jgi:hypothetical protein
MTYLYTPADWQRITRPDRSRCTCGRTVYSRDRHNGWSMWAEFIGLFGEPVTACQCGRRLVVR